MWCLTKRRTDVVPLWDRLAPSQSCLSMHLQLPWLPFPGHRGRCDAVASLCACVCHMNELKNVTIVTHTMHTHTHTIMARRLPSLPSPLPKPTVQNNKAGHKCEPEPVNTQRHTEMCKSRQEAHSALTAQWE